MSSCFDFEDMNDKNSFEGVSKENLELFKRAIDEALASKIRKIEEEIKDVELPETSKRTRHK